MLIKERTAMSVTCPASSVQQRDHMSIDHNDLLRHAYPTCRPHYEALFMHRLGVT